MADDFTVSILADIRGLDKSVKEADKKLENFQNQVKKRRAIQLTASIAKLQVDLDKARRRLSQFKKEGDEKAQIKARIDIRGIQEKIRTANGSLRSLQKEAKNSGKSFFSLNGIIKDGLKAFGGFFIVRQAIESLKSVVNSALDFETAFAGVRKTIDGTENDFKILERQFRELSKTIPISIEELLRIGELGGQLGVPIQNIEEFTKVIAELGVTTNLSVDEAATQLARFANIFGTPLDEVRNLGSSIVGLGNNFATTEAEIVNFALRIAAVGAQAGLTEADVFGIAAAFTSVGIQAEAGGTAVQTGLQVINNAVNSGSAELQKFAAVAGLTADQFVQLWKNDTGQAFSLFIKGLGDAGDDASQILGELLGDNVRLQRAFLSAARDAEGLAEAIQLANDEYEKNTALTKEAEKRFNTNSSRLQKLSNTWKDLAITVGGFILEQLVPVLEKLTALALVIVRTGDFVSEFGNRFLSIGKIFKALVSGPINILLLAMNSFIPVSELVSKAWDKAGRILDNVFVSVANVGGRAAESISFAWNAAVEGISFAVGGVIKSTKAAAQAISSLPGIDIGIERFDNALSQINSIKSSFKVTATEVKSAFSGAADSVGTEFSKIAQSAKNIFAGVDSGSELDLSSILGDLNGGGAGGTNSALKETEKSAKEAEKSVKEYNKELEKLGKASDDINKKSQEFFKEIVETIGEAREKISELQDEFASFEQGETEDFVRDSAERAVELAEEEEEVRKRINELKQKEGDIDASAIQKQKNLQKELSVLENRSSEQDGDTKSSSRESLQLQIEKKKQQLEEFKNEEGISSATRDRLELEKELNDVIRERNQISTVFSEGDPSNDQKFQDELSRAQERSSANEFELSQLNLKEKLDAKKEEVEEEISKQQQIISIQERFLELQNAKGRDAFQDRKKLFKLADDEFILDQEKRSALLEELGFKDLTREQELELLKQVERQKSLDEEKRLIISQQRELLEEKEQFFILAEQAHAVSTDNMKEKTQELIDIIIRAQKEQIRLNALRNSSGGGRSSISGGTTNVNVTQNISSGVDFSSATNSLIRKVNQ